MEGGRTPRKRIAGNPQESMDLIEGRDPTIMMVGCRPLWRPANLKTGSELLQGTLDMLILRTLLFGQAHGHQIAKHIQRTTEDVLQVEHGSLYPALHRMERKGWITSKWLVGKDRNREFKFYRLTQKGRKQLVCEESRWKQVAAAVARVMGPSPEGKP